MKPGQILGALIIGVCILAAGYSLRGSVQHSLSVKEAMAAPGEPCKVYGKIVKGSDRYDIRAPRLDFMVKDKKGDTVPVVYRNSKPATFDSATDVGVVGAYRDGAFQADSLVLKCPSKYETKPPVPGKATPGPAYSGEAPASKPAGRAHAEPVLAALSTLGKGG